ncbi:MAG: SDR family oxidoreductase [Bryobacteraceae bacterium]|nr:SDR family oxidoreductase [Bryobacteraceae bacterium]
MANLTGKVAVVTGSSKGIGAAIAERLANDGVAVAINYGRSTKEANELVAKIEAKGGKAVALQADIASEADVVKLIADAQAKLGPLDILVNNAGIYEFSAVDALTADHIDRQLNLNVRGLLLATREAVKAFGDRGGVIVNISSSAVETPPPNGSVYAGTKGAVDAITRSLGQELGAKKIRVVSIAPGFIETEGTHTMPGGGDFKAFAVSKTPLGRPGAPTDVAAAVAYAASDDASFVTGAVLTVNGGIRI